MDKYIKILVIDIDKKGPDLLSKIKGIGYTNSALIDARLVRDEMMAMDYITQFTPNVIYMSGMDENVYKCIENPSEIVDAKVVAHSTEKMALPGLKSTITDSEIEELLKQ